MAESSSSRPTSSTSHDGHSSGSEEGFSQQQYKVVWVNIIVQKHRNRRSYSCKTSVRNVQPGRRQMLLLEALFGSNNAASPWNGQERSFTLKPKAKQRTRSSFMQPFDVPCESSASCENDATPTKDQLPSAASPVAPSDSFHSALSECKTLKSVASTVEQPLPTSTLDADTDVNSSFLGLEMVHEAIPAPAHSVKHVDSHSPKEQSASRVESIEPKTTATVRLCEAPRKPPTIQTAPTRSWASTYGGFGQSLDSRTNWKPKTVKSKEDLAAAGKFWANVRRSKSEKEKKEKAATGSEVNRTAGQETATESTLDGSTFEEGSSPSAQPASVSSRHPRTRRSNVVSELHKDFSKIAPFRTSSPFSELGGADSDSEEEVGNGCLLSKREFRKTWDNWTNVKQGNFPWGSMR